MDPGGQPSSAAQRRWGDDCVLLGGMQQSIAQALATFTHHSAQRQKTVRVQGSGYEVKYTAKFREKPLTSPAGTQYFTLDVDEVPAAGGSRPDRLASVCGAQERVQRHIVEQLVDPVRGLPVLDALVPQVGQLVEVLMMLDFLSR